MEVLGCGMVDPRVLVKAGVDPDEYTGFAAGFGVERFAMVLFEVQDLRMFWQSDARFLSQFPADIQASERACVCVCVFKELWRSAASYSVWKIIHSKSTSCEHFRL